MERLVLITSKVAQVACFPCRPDSLWHFDLAFHSKRPLWTTGRWPPPTVFHLLPTPGFETSGYEMFSLHHAHPLLSCTWIRNCLSCVRNVSPTYRPRLASSSWQKPTERTRVQFNPNYWRVTPPLPIVHVYGLRIVHATVAYNPTSPMHHLYSRRIASNLLSQYKERGSLPRLITSQGTGLLSEQSLMAFWARTCVQRWQQPQFVATSVWRNTRDGMTERETKKVLHVDVMAGDGEMLLPRTASIMDCWQTICLCYNSQKAAFANELTVSSSMRRGWDRRRCAFACWRKCKMSRTMVCCVFGLSVLSKEKWKSTRHK